MSNRNEPRHVLIVSCADDGGHWRALFQQEALQGWEAFSAGSFEEAHFLVQHTGYDAALVADCLCREAPDGLAWLARQREVPLVYLAESEADKILQAYADGINAWLPRALALSNPALLAATLERVAEWSSLRRGRQEAAQTVQHCRRQIDRLADILWRTVPLKTEQPWLSQRHLLERLQEEIARAQRFDVPLAIALGEVQPTAADGSRAEPELADWTIERIVRGKRRCDVAGQYGVQGFLLLLMHTPEPGAGACCRRFRHLLEAAPAIAGHGPHGPVRAYLGAASFSAAAATASSLLHLAEQQLELARSREPAIVA
jgi:hypothetical protein